IKEKVENLEYGGYVSTSELLDKTVDLVMTDISSDANSYSIFNDTDIVFKGYPSENKNGFVVNPSVCFSITSNCQNKEIAWRFIRYFLLDEYQSSIKNGIPLKKSYKDNIFVDATQTYYGVIDEKVSSEIKKKVVEVIENADVLNCVEMNDRIYKIIEEETSLYFDNQIDVDQMSQSIQSKVSLYLNEIK
ncbi:MAG: hypothetical protein IKK88_05640, partial [Oscillospiraceae bacterium]|nr:hypothetical protein [Oscillospiraceae bacterium]